MEYSLDLTLSPDPALLPVAARVFIELSEVREGPGEEMERLATAVGPVIGSALTALGSLPGRPSLRLGIRSDQVRVEVALEASAGGRSLLGPHPDAALAALQAAFDEVEPPASGDGPFRLVLIRHIPC